MARNPLKNLLRFYAALLYWTAPLYKQSRKPLVQSPGRLRPKRIVLFVNRPQDVDLLIGLHKRARVRADVHLGYWVSKGCARKHPKDIERLRNSEAVVEQIVSYANLGKMLAKLLDIDAFLTTVETTSSKNKLPFMLTRLANAVRIPTYTLQHGFETVGLTYRDALHGPEVKFAASTVLTWGPVENLPAWVAQETRNKAVAVGYPLEPASPALHALQPPGDPRPIVGVFDNLHWHRYSPSYTAAFVDHLERAAKQRPGLRFILRSHPASLRNRSRELASRLVNMENVEFAESIGEVELQSATPWLLSHALGVITTPSTIALDGALARCPVAVTGYGLTLDCYAPLAVLERFEDWLLFLDRLTDSSWSRALGQNGERFLNRAVLPGDAPGKILELMMSDGNVRERPRRFRVGA